MPVKIFDANTPQLKVIKEWFEVFSSLDINRRRPAAKDFKYEMLPKPTGLVGEGGKEYLDKKFSAMVNSTMTRMEVDVHEVIEAPGKVVIHISAVCFNADGTTFNFDSVGIFTLVEEDGELKVSHCKDFADHQQRSAIIAGTGQ